MSVLLRSRSCSRPGCHVGRDEGHLPLGPGQHVTNDPAVGSGADEGWRCREAGTSAPDEKEEQLMRTMFAKRGDRLVVRSHVNLPGRDAEILEVAHPDGTPPYRVRWSDN